MAQFELAKSRFLQAEESRTSEIGTAYYFGGGNTGTISNTAKLAGIFNQLHYSRQDELEADQVGQNLLRKAHIDPSGLGMFFERLKKEEAERRSGDESDFPEFLAYFSTHPHTQTRINKLKTNEIRATNYKKTLNEKEWQALKNICADKMGFN